VTRTTPLGAVAALTLILAGASWIVAVQRMEGMDMGVATELGSLWFFFAVWILMMAAMMLPGTVPALRRLVGSASNARVLRFPASYLAVWTLIGFLVYAVYRPHGTTTAALITVAAGLYEVTPLKRVCRRRCRETVRSGFAFGAYCLGSSIGWMAMLLALGPMSVTWMAIVALIVSFQKLAPPAPVLDGLLALGMCGLGIALVLT
jgi:predicted metal-binding membrane protein